MAVVTGMTAARMQEIEAASVVDGDVVGGHLILQKHDGTEIDAGSVVGPPGPQGPAGIAKIPIPGQILIWPGTTLPNLTQHGKWVWANGDPYDIATYPQAAANIDPAWNTAAGQANPGAGKFRVPDMRGFVPAGLDAMPVGSARANRMTRSVAIVIAGKTGEEYHVITIPEMPVHAHSVSDGGHSHDISHDHPLQMLTSYGTGFQPGSGGGIVVDRGGGGSGSPIKYFLGNSSWNGSGISIQNRGGDGQHETVQPTIMVPYIVKLDDPA